MKKIVCVFLAGLLCVLLAACGGGPAPGGEPASSGVPVSSQGSASSSEEQGELYYTSVLIADFSQGASDRDAIKEYPIETKEGPDPALLAQELSALTGLDFLVEITETADGFTVDWAAGSTLIAGLAAREQKEDFFFFDVSSLRWFMMDSLWRTLLENFDAENIYYTMDGGKELELDELGIETFFPVDLPYLGSPFYFEHYDVRGEDEVFAQTAGLWRIGGEDGAASVEMDGAGRFIAYLASGALEAEGYLEYTGEGEGGAAGYDLYTDDGAYYTSLHFRSADSFCLGDNEELVYILARG